MMPPEFKSAQDILVELAKDLGIEVNPAGPDEDVTLTLDFDNQVQVSLAADERDLVIFGRIGTLPDDGTQLLETLMTANMFWCDTNGATLSLNPATRDILMAMRLPERDWSDVTALRQAIEMFAELQQGWITDIEDSTDHPRTDDFMTSQQFIQP